MPSLSCEASKFNQQSHPVKPQIRRVAKVVMSDPSNKEQVILQQFLVLGLMQGAGGRTRQIILWLRCLIEPSNQKRCHRMINSIERLDRCISQIRTGSGDPSQENDAILIGY